MPTKDNRRFRKELKLVSLSTSLLAACHKNIYSHFFSRNCEKHASDGWTQFDRLNIVFLQQQDDSQRAVIAACCAIWPFKNI